MALQGSVSDFTLRALRRMSKIEEIAVERLRFLEGDGMKKFAKSFLDKVGRHECRH